MSRRGCRTVAEHLPYANRTSFRVTEMVEFEVKANSGANPNSPCFPAAF
jgi:hypothetical protein